MDDQKIYQRQELLDIYKNPVNQGSLDAPDVTVTEKNPFCGDVVSLDLKIQDNIIVDAKYHGSACAVSVISSSLFTEEIIGKSLEDAKKITKQDVLDLMNLELTTSRVKCATLIFEAFQKAITEYDQ